LPTISFCKQTKQTAAPHQAISCTSNWRQHDVPSSATASLHHHWASRDRSTTNSSSSSSSLSY
jgi:hypothetical protein